jgi:hypothetical protein
MPFYQQMAWRATRAFRRNNIAKLNVSVAAPGARLSAVAQALGIAKNKRDEQVLDAIPDSIQDVIVTVVRHAITKGVPVYFGWSPAYDYSVKIWEARAVEDSPTAITLHLEGPYPDQGRP